MWVFPGFPGFEALIPSILMQDIVGRMSHSRSETTFRDLPSVSLASSIRCA